MTMKIRVRYNIPYSIVRTEDPLLSRTVVIISELLMDKTMPLTICPKKWKRYCLGRNKRAVTIKNREDLGVVGIVGTEIIYQENKGDKVIATLEVT